MRSPRSWRGGALVALAASVATLGSCVKEERRLPPSPARDGVDRPMAGPPAASRTEAERLEALRAELSIRRHRCTACHGTPKLLAARLHADPAPDLGAVAARVSPNYLRAFLADPQGTHPGTAMPDVLRSVAEDERETVVEDLVHYLASMSPQPFDVSPQETDLGQIERGRRLFHGKGCVACHLPRSPAHDFDEELGEFEAEFDAMAAAGVVEGGHAAWPREFVPLPDLRRKASLAQLSAFLLDPASVRPASLMPDLMLEEKEARAIARYLLAGEVDPETAPVERFPGLSYDYYEFPMDGKLPDFEGRTPARTGSIDRPRIDVERRDGDFAFRFTGSIAVPTDGEWTFFTTSDDGTKLWLDGELWVDNDGTHPMREVSGRRTLLAGEYEFELHMFEQAGGEGLEVHWQGPGQDKAPIPASAFSRSSRVFAPEDPGTLSVDAARATRGKQHFVELGCAQCHHLAGADLAQRRFAPLWAKLPAGKGCLADAPAGGAPAFALTEAEVASLDAALADPSWWQRPLEPADHVVRTMAERNCYACHERERVGGPNEQRRLYFTTVGAVDMGEEGKIPPPLRYVGSKLRPQWMRALLSEGARSRPHMMTTMPHYDHPSVAALADQLRAVDGVEGDLAEPEFDLEASRAGQLLVGKDGLGCVDCHSFGEHQSLGIPAGDLSKVYSRLTHGWFDRYLRKPFRMRPGTRMPSYFAEDGVSAPEVLEGDPTAQIDAIWNYLSMGGSAPLPKGLKVEAGTYDLVVDDRPVLVGVFMKGVSPRVLCVGFNERAHYAYDMRGARLAKLWRGPFFNAEGTWHGRAGKLESPPSSDFVDLPPGPVAARLPSKNAPWPTEDARWIGRGLDDNYRPVFFSAIGDVEIEEKPVAELRRGGSVILRSFEFRSEQPVEDLYLRLAVGRAVESTEEGHRVAGFGTIALSGDVGEAFVRGEQEAELRVPVRLVQQAEAYVGRCEVMVQW